jgi:hypothetical protein
LVTSHKSTFNQEIMAATDSESDDSDTIRGQLKRKIESILSGPREGQQFRINVFLGGTNSAQGKWFKIVARDYESQIHFHMITAVDIKRALWSLEDFISWLKAADAYFLLSHPHQGMEGESGWDLDELEASLSTALRGRVGFPNYEELNCGIFTQVSVDT